MEVSATDVAIATLRLGVELHASPEVVQPLELAAVLCVGVLLLGGVASFRREGGIIAGVSSVGSSLPRTFSAMMYMARANCSAFSRPVFSMSHRPLSRESQRTHNKPQ